MKILDIGYPKMIHRSTLLLIMLALSYCGDPQQDAESNSQQANARWYAAQQVAMGADVFATHCAQCHGAEAQGLVSDWRSKLEDGSFPPPPLNGSAHAWHHPLSVLLQVIDNGGVEYGGKMPGFSALLSGEEKLAAIAYFQDFWSDEIYQQWLQMGGTN